MSEINSRDLLAKLRSEQADAALNPAVYDQITGETHNKLQDLNAASQKKADLLSDLSRTVEKRNSLAGTLSSFGTGSDTVREFTEGTVSGLGSVVGGVGKVADVTGLDTIGEYLQKQEKSLYGVADSIDDQQLPSFQHAVNQNTPTGDLFDSSTWDVGEITAEGSLGLLANMAGQFTPQLLAMVLTKGQSVAAQMGTTATVGGLQAGGGASNSAEEYIDSLDTKQLAEASGLYRDLIAQNMKPEEAKDYVKSVASSAAFAGAAPLGALGGAATAYVLGPLKNKLVGNAAARTAERVVISGLEEGAQEVAENVAAKALTNAAIEGNQDITEGSFTDFTLGAGFGAAIGVPGSTADTGSVLSEKAKEAVGKASTAFNVKFGAGEKAAIEAKDVSLLKNEKGFIKDALKAYPAIAKIIQETEDGSEQQIAALRSLREVVTDLSENVNFLKDDIKEIEQSSNPTKKEESKLRQLREELNNYQETLDNAQNLNIELNKETVADIDVSKIIEDITGLKKGESVDELITLMMADPSKVTTEDIDTVLEKVGTELKPEQQTFLRSYTEAEKALNKVKNNSYVSKDVFEGGEGYKGLFQYQRAFDNAVNAGNRSAAEQELQGVERFAASRQEKLDAVKSAFSELSPNRKQVQIVFDRQRGWVQADEKLTDDQVATNGGVTIHSGSGRLIEAIEQESEALNKTLARMQNTLARANNYQPVEPTQVASPEVEPNFNPAPQATTQKESTQINEAFEPAPQVQTEVDTSSKETERDKGSLQRNRIKAFFTQVKGKESDKTARPLVAKSNFLSGLDAEPESISDFISEELTDKQQAHVSLFKEKAQEWSQLYDLLKLKQEKYLFQDPIQFLLEDGKLPENVKTALSFSAFNYLAENGFGTAYNDKDTVNTILKRDSDHPISPEERVLFTAGTNEKLVTQSLGKAASQALGIKPDPDAPLNEISRLEGSLGNHALTVLLREGLVERVSVEGKIFKNKNTLKENATHPFIRITRSWDGSRAGPIHEVTNQIATSAKNTGGVLSKLFKAESGKKEPSFEKVTKVPTKAKGTRQEVSSKQKEILKKQGENAHYLRAEMVQAFTAFDKDILDSIAGIEPVNETTHKARHLGQSAKNEALSRELDYMRDFISGLKDKGTNLDQPFFFGREVWKVFRVGLASNTVNPQTSKIHRHMISMGGWETEVEFDSTNYDSFILGVGESLGVSTDKQRNTQSLEEAKALIEQDSIRLAVQALQSLQAGNSISRTEQEHILTAIKEGGENFHSLEGLTSLAQMETARTEGKSGFKTTLGREVDGVTNGPMLTLLQLAGAASTDLLKNTLRKGGFYFEGDEQQEFTEWKSVPGNEDLYQSLAFDVHQAMQNAYTNFKDLRHSIRATRYLLGKFVEDGAVTKAGRTSIKTPLTGFAFGSSVNTAVDAMGADLVDAYYTKVEEAKDSTELVQAIRAINIMIARKAPKIPENLTKQQALDLELTPKQENAVVKTFSETTGSLVAQTMESRFADLIKTRDILNQASNVTFDLYDSAFKALREKVLTDLTRTGEIETDSEGKPLQDLNRDQESAVRKQLKALEPVVHTPLSKISGQLSAAMNMAKTYNEQTDDSKYQARSNFNKPIPQNTKGAKPLREMRSKGAIPREKQPGVATVIGGIHSTDSTISSLAYDENVALNVHDAHVLSVSGTQKGAQSLNKHTFNQMLNYSLPMEIMESLGRSYKAYVNFLNANPDIKNVLEPEYNKLADSVSSFLVDKELREQSTDALENLLGVTKRTAIQARVKQLNVMKNLSAVDQYALEGGSFKVSKANRNKVTKTYRNLVKLVTPNDSSNNVSRNSWGKVGNPRIPSDPELARFMDSEGELTFGKLYPILSQRIRATQSKRMAQFNLSLLKQLKSKVGNDLKIEWVTPDSPQNTLDTDITEARAWYALSKTKGEAIYVKSPEFSHSAVTPETLLHELTHAAVAKVIASPNKQTQPLIDELETLRKKAKDIVDADSSLSGLTNAVQNVQELVAWGMTNEQFQRDVLNQIRLPSQNSDNTLISGLRSFIDTLTRILFSGSKKTSLEREESGLAILIANTAGLMAEGTNEQADLVLKQEDFNPEDQIKRFTTEQVFDGLADTKRPHSTEYASHLKQTLDSIVEKIHGPFGAYTVEAKKQATYTPEEVYLKALANEETPFASRALAHLSLSNQEAFVLEQVEMTMQEVVARSHATYDELAKLFREARASLKNDPNFDQEAYDFIFNPERGDEGKSGYLARFAAVGMAYQPLYEHLQNYSTKITSKRIRDMKLGEAIQEVFNRGLTLLNKRITHTYEGQRGDIKLRALLQRLVDLEAKKSSSLSYQNNATQQKLADAIHEISEKGRETVEKVGKSSFFRNNPSKIVKALGSVSSTIAGDRVDKLFDAIEDVRNRNHQERFGMMAAMLNEVRGVRSDTEQFHELLRYSNKHEQERKHLIDEVSSIAKSAFKNDGKDLTREEREAITRSFIRTDLASLLDDFTLDQIAELFLDPEKLETQIKSFEQELSGSHKDYYLNATKGLGYHLATGFNVSDNLMLNAHNIAYLANTPKLIQGKNKTAEANLPIIDKLASLYAVRWLPEEIKKNATQTLKSETRRGKESGIEVILKLHKGLQKDALNTLFEGNPVHFIKGYTKEIYDPHINLVVATAEEGRKLERQGYSRGPTLTKDPADSGPELRLYSSRDGGLRSHTTGIFSYTGKRSRGSKVHSGLGNAVSDTSRWYNNQQNSEIAKRTESRINRMFKKQPNFDPSKLSQTRLVPVLNHYGVAVNHRYMMSDKNKDELLRRNNEFDNVLGSMAGSTYDKASTETINETAIKALKEQYDAEYKIKPHAYVKVSLESTDEEIRETYQLLPEAAKRQIKKVWGKDEMWVRKDLYDLNFGYRKYSLAEIFDKTKQERNIMESITADMLSFFLGEKAAVRVGQAEDVWQEVVRMTKDILVIKNLFTLIGNISSNVTLLLWMGVSPTKIISTHTTAIRGLVSHQRDRKELTKLQRLLSIDYIAPNQQDEVKNRIVELEDSLARNPVNKLIQAGLFQTIVEDVDNEDDRFSYTSRLTQFTSEHTDFVPDSIKTVGKHLFMTHDTPLYKLLNQATSMSDFVARYSLHEHLTTRENEPMGDKEAIQVAVDAFVNYDIPSHKKLQYLNDMGIVWFTKYYMRIQKVIFHLYRDNPGKSLAMVTLENLFPWIPTLVDAGFWNNIGNPFSTGAFKFPGSIDEIVALKTALSPFN